MAEGHETASLKPDDGSLALLLQVGNTAGGKGTKTSLPKFH